MEITGNLRIAATTVNFTEIEVDTFHVAAGATLEVDVDLIDRYNCQGGFCPPLGETKIDVDGAFILRNTRINEGGYHIVRREPRRHRLLRERLDHRHPAVRTGWR